MTTDKQYKGIKVEGIAKGNSDWYLFTELCKGCGLCLEKCPLNAKDGEKCLNWSKEIGIYATPAVEPKADRCTGCGMCSMVCPDSAIKIVKK